MSKHTISWFVVLAIGFAAMVHAAQFTMDLYVGDGTGKTLTFGLGSEAYLAGVPPFQGPAPLNVLWLEGPGDVTDAKIDEDYSRLSTYIKADADAALWKLYVRNDMKLTFKLSEGALASGNVLKLYPEDNDSEAIDLEDEAVVNVKADKTYLIDYRKTSSTGTALPCPPVKHFQMNRGRRVLALDLLDDSEYGLGGDATVKAYSSEEQDGLTLFTELDGNYGSFDAATSTLNMTNMNGVARIQFNYWYVDGARSSEKGTVIVEVTDGLMTTLVSKEDVATGYAYTGSVVAVDTAEEGYAGTVLTYKIDFEPATIGDNVTLKVVTPQFTPSAAAYTVQYCFKNSPETAEGDEYTALPEGGAVYEVGSESIYLKVKATLTDKCDAGFVTPTLTVDSKEVEMEAVQFILLNGGTMDIDGNGEIIVEDAIMMYNFIALGGVSRPARVTEKQITQGIDVSKVDSAKALETLRSLAPFLDYDGNGEIIVEDAIMMYNFIALGGVTRPTRVTEKQITQGIDASKVDAAKALESFRKYVSK